MNYLIKATVLTVSFSVMLAVSAFSSENTGQTAEPAAADTADGIDYMVLVNKTHGLPQGWEDALETVSASNSVGDEVEVEKNAYEAYLLLKNDLEENDEIHIELDSAYRSVAEQQSIMDSFIGKYGAEYAAKTVAQPGFSEHHTGLALDLYFRTANEDGTFTDVYYNEDMMQEAYTVIWDTIHAKLAGYGFILRYLEGREHITGYGYEPWHIRYIGDPGKAAEIMGEDITLEEYVGDYRAPEVVIDYGTSALYTEEELKEAVLLIKCDLAGWEGCELHSLRYAGDECASEENLAWLNSLDGKGNYTRAAGFECDFHTASDIQGAWEPDHEYADYQFWLARTDEDGWDIVSWGY